ncbi:prtrc system protein e [Terrimonas sp.]|jgi:PRTRC genetic system protein E|uniref:prtrc system protein e n=1 Tax=Terrimonas sp. TaxID=1914338 RepID=UPI000962628B|nr:prtrc system protein e [Terrimonas sp.]OJW81127.1 MAG: prtrc system protein e [Bacteroidetes bacterium 46-16]PVD50152.1 prtrc system protein e [Terrimonas sp.]
METTNFFSSVAALNITGDLQVTIRKGAESNWIVSVMLNNEQCGDEARKLIPPLNLRGSAEELDNGFFERITAPIQTVSGLMVDMEGFMKQLEEVKKQSAMEKEKADRERKEKEAREKKYKEAMQKVDELEKEGKYRDAWMKVPDPSEYPEQAETIRKRKSSLSSKFAPDLFGSSATPVADEQPQRDEVNAEEEGNEENAETTDEDWEEDEETNQ